MTAKGKGKGNPQGERRSRGLVSARRWMVVVAITFSDRGLLQSPLSV